MRIRPFHAIFVVLLFVGGFLAAELFMEGALAHDGFTRVKPDRSGVVRIDLSEIGSSDVKFFRFLNAGNQEVKFFVARDSEGVVQVAFDANEICYKLKRGYRAEDGWVTCNKCDKAFRLEEVNEGGGGCKPVPLEHRIEGNMLILAEDDILTGWRFFH